MRKLAFLMVVAVLGLSFWTRAGAGADSGIAGWEKGGEYDRLFDPKEADTLKGRVSKIIEITPIAGMAVGVGFEIEDKKDKTIEIVHLGPKSYVDMASIGLKPGDEVKVVGAWAELDTQDVMLAVKVKKGEDLQLKVRRTRDGFPYWSMTPEERQREMSAD